MKDNYERNTGVKRGSRELRHELFVIVAMLILLPILFQFMPEQRWHDGTPQHSVYIFTYRASMVIEFFILWKYKMLKDNIIGSIMIIFLAPVALLTLGIEWLYRKVFHVQNTSNPVDSNAS